MTDFIYWLIFSALALVFFYGIYHLLLRKTALLIASRTYLLLTTLMALVIPLPWQYFMASPGEVAFAVNLDLATVFQATIETQNSQDFNWLNLLLVIYLIPAIVLSGLFLFSNARMMFLIRKGEFLCKGNTRIILLHHDMLPFSWFGKIVLSYKDYHSVQVEKIIAHELIHIRQQHFVDLLFAELMVVLQWFNPAAWSYRYAIRDVHEYLADRGTIQSGFRINEYQQLLTGLAGPVPAGILSNNIKHSFLKNRFIMMTKTKPGKLAQLRFIVALVSATTFGWVIFSTACQAQEQKPKPPTVNEPPKPPPVEVPAQIISAVPVTNPQAKAKKDVVDTPDDEGNIFVVVEDPPTFPGGNEARINYFIENIKYPQEAKAKRIQGTVFVTYVVEKDGAITNVKILRGIGGGCDEEALRVVENMPKWVPGKQRGKAVRVQFNIPIKFALE